MNKDKVIALVIGIFVLFIHLSVRILKGSSLLPGAFYSGFNDKVRGFGGLYSRLISMLPVQLVLLFSIALAIITILLIFRITKELRINSKVGLLTSLFFILSPLFLYSFLDTSVFSLAMVSVLAALLLLIKGKRVVLAVLVSIVIPFIDPVFGLLYIISAASLLAYLKRSKNILLAPIVSLCAFLAVLISKGLAPSVVLYESLLHRINIFTDLGSGIGFSVFSIILLGVGFYHLWSDKKKLYPVLLLAGILFLASVFIPESRIFANVLFCAFGAVGFIHIAKRKWHLVYLRNATLVIIILGLLSSLAVFGSGLVFSQPDSAHLSALEFLSGLPEGDVLTYPYYNWVGHFSGHDIVFDAQDMFLPDYRSVANDTDVMLNSRSLAETSRLMNQYDVRYIFIDPAMKEGLVWKYDQEGLLFLFRNEDAFRRVYSVDGMEIWEHNQGYQID